MQGFCTPSEEVDTDETGQGTDFVDTEAGGFDQGQGESNVSDKVEPENIVSPKAVMVTQQNYKNKIL